MDKQQLPDLLSDLEQELIRLGYAEGTMKLYQRRWEQLTEFAQKRGELYYTEQLGIDFALEHFGITQDDFGRILSQSQTQELRIIRMVGDFQLHRAILRRYCKRKKILIDPVFIEASEEFKAFCIAKEYSDATIDSYLKRLAYFMDYLTAQKISGFEDITLDTINAYIRTLAGYAHKTVENNISSLRAFFRFLNQEGTISTDFAAKIPVVKTHKQTTLPSVWTQVELKKLIDAIDRGNPKGKRDYAIILLACRLGMRCTDIKNLCFDNFNWVEKKLCFVQSKTNQKMELPLVSDVGWAVIDYLKHGRPKIDSQRVFVRHIPPFLPFSKEDNLYKMIKLYMEKAHIPKLKKRRGMHSLRHTMASFLLEKDTPLPVISDILGHLDTNSTAVYLKVDMKRLAECPLDFEEAIHIE